MSSYYGFPNINNNPMALNELQAMKNRIDQQIMQYQQPMQQQNPTPITQNFQLAPNTNSTNNDFDGKFANDVEVVKNTLAIKDTLFINKDYSLLWIKDAIGNIRSYTLNEIIEKDEKDIEIDKLKDEIKELKEMIINGKSNASNDDANIANKKSTRVSTNKSNDE